MVFANLEKYDNAVEEAKGQDEERSEKEANTPMYTLSDSEDEGPVLNRRRVSLPQSSVSREKSPTKLTTQVPVDTTDLNSPSETGLKPAKDKTRNQTTSLSRPSSLQALGVTQQAQNVVPLKRPNNTKESKPEQAKVPTDVTAQRNGGVPDKDSIKHDSAIGRVALRAPTKAVMPGTVPSAVARRSSKALQPTANVRGHINMVNEPKQLIRQPWKNGNKLYNKMRYRRIAEKRSRVEGTPDPSALDFVHGKPPGVKEFEKTTHRNQSNDSIYGRRERTDVSRATGTTHPLQPYEIGKVPMKCFDWHNGGCKIGPEKCRFLHRERDPSGEPYRTSPWDGRIPPKYADPPVTCLFWLRSDHGCSQSATDCNFAHYNTGLLKTASGVMEKIDKRETPGEIQRRGQKGFPKYADPPMTCFFWLRGDNGCQHSTETCRYAHWNTGWVGHLQAPAEKVEKHELPKFEAQKRPSTISAGDSISAKTLPNDVPRGPSPLTCPFWLRGENGCIKPANKCKFAHKNTGRLAGIPGLTEGVETIDPTEAPRSGVGLMDSDLAQLDNDARRNNAVKDWSRGNSDQKRLALDEPHQSSTTQIHPAGSPFRNNGIQHKFPATCHFWNKGKCKHSDAECPYQHCITGMVADAPRGGSYGISVPGFSTSIRTDDQPNLPDGLAKKEKHLWKDTPPHTRNSVTTSREPAKFTPNQLSPTTILPSDPHLSANSHPATDITEIELPYIPLSPSELDRMIEKEIDLDFYDMFLHNGEDGEDAVVDKRAYLLFDPETHEEEHELIMRWLAMHRVNCFSLAFDGSWEIFSQEILDGKSGIIIAHADFEGYAEVPGFGDLLSRKVTIWSLGQPSPESLLRFQDADLISTYNRHLIFTHGGMIHITDDVFLKKPQLALRIIQMFIAKIEQIRQKGMPAVLQQPVIVDDGLLLWRLCVRPALLQWIADMLEDEASRLPGDPDYER